jgi:hypothetical protein
MRNLTIEYITGYLLEYPDLMVELDISPDELDELSNRELLDLLVECVEIICGQGLHSLLWLDSGVGSCIWRQSRSRINTCLYSHFGLKYTYD